jgi:hypothetical protein
MIDPNLTFQEAAVKNTAYAFWKVCYSGLCGYIGIHQLLQDSQRYLTAA